MKTRRKIAVVTGARAEYGILKPLLYKMIKSGDFKLQLLVGGIHLLRQYGSTVGEIENDGFKIDKKIEMYVGNPNDPAYYGKALGRGIDEFIKAFSELKPDILVVLGDRLEPLAAVLAAAFLKINIAHIHGGDRTDSTDIDESIRHSITRFAHIHLTPTRGTESRLIKMGEEPWRIYRVGALGLDSLINNSPPSKEEIFKKFNLSPQQRLIICLFHSIHLKSETAGKDMEEILKSIKELKTQTVVIYPNNDDGSEDIISKIKKYGNLPFISVFPSIIHEDYINLLRYADVMVGNSSSGIIETPSLSVPFVNVGERQKIRERGSNVIDAAARKKDIVKAVNKCFFDKKFILKVRKGNNPYGDGKTGGRILKILGEIKIDEKLSQKKITY